MDAITPFAELDEVLRDFVARVQVVLGDNFVGAYLQGSFAVGDADQFSDVDWTVAIRRELTDAEVTALQVMHGEIFDQESQWAKHLEGSYFPLDVLADHGRVKEPLWYLDNGSRQMIQDAHDNELVVRWVTREHGITLAGVDAKTIIPVVEADDLRGEVRKTMDGWGNEILNNPNKIDNQWYQMFATISYCRMLHTMATGRIESKPAGAAWALANMGSEWHGLIERAVANRPKGFAAVHEAADPDEVNLTLKFIAFALASME